MPALTQETWNRMNKCDYCNSAAGSDRRGNCASCGAPKEILDHDMDFMRYGLMSMSDARKKFLDLNNADPEAAKTIAMQLEECERLGTDHHTISMILGNIYDNYDMDTIDLGHRIYDRKKRQEENRWMLESMIPQPERIDFDIPGGAIRIEHVEEKPKKQITLTKFRIGKTWEGR